MKYTPVTPATWRCCRRCIGAPRASTVLPRRGGRLVFAVHVGQRLPAGIADDEEGVRRWEAAGRGHALVAVRPQFRAGIDRQLKAPACGKRSLRGDLRNPSDQSRCCILDRVFAPCASKKEKHNVRLVERGALMRPCSDM
jgi:hypothetical protein